MCARRHWTTDRSEENWIAYRILMNAKKKQIRKDSTKTRRKTIAALNADPKAIWKIAKWAGAKAGNPPQAPQFPPMTDPATGIVSSDNAGKSAILARKIFPPPVEADLKDIQGAEYPQPLLTEREVTAEQVIAALRNTHPDKAPGPDGIPNRFLKECRHALAPVLAKVFEGCLRLNNHPRRFRESTTVLLPKPQKPSYQSPGTYRPIALLNMIGKGPSNTLRHS
jgi:hypothetical protein